MFNWQEFLARTQITIVNSSSVAAPSVNNNQTFLILRTDSTILSVDGPDASKFLQGQCTCDFSELEAGNYLLGAHCNHKGRMYSSFTAAHIENGAIGLRVHTSISKQAYQSLKKYIVFSKAQLTETEHYGCLLLHGTNAGKILSDAGLNLPDSGAGNTTGKFILNQSACVLYHGHQQFEIWASADTLNKVILVATNSACILSNNDGENYADLLAIRQGLGGVRLQTLEQFIPQDLNFQLVNGVSFSKGCYTGQEIIARMHYRGKLKRHMYHALVDNHQLFAAGTEIRDANKDKVVGQVVFSALNENRQVELLAVVNEDIKNDGSANWVINSTAKLSWLSLPYAIP